uniref:Similar to NRPB1 (RNA POLYMERASE II LARGE SUBUNIT) n=1 Tax=Arundo donax TaxID=35708 RepID=A0A0A9CZY2_ARUDO
MQRLWRGGSRSLVGLVTLGWGLLTEKSSARHAWLGWRSALATLATLSSPSRCSTLASSRLYSQLCDVSASTAPRSLRMRMIPNSSRLRKSGIQRID